MAEEYLDPAGRLWVTDDGETPVYVHLRAEDRGRPVDHTIELGAGVSVDYDADGRAVGVEFL